MVVPDGIPVNFILDAGHECKHFPCLGNGNFATVRSDGPCAVFGVFYHSKDRNIKVILLQNAFCTMDLSKAAIHQDEVRQTGKARFLSLFPFFEITCKPAGQDFFHTAVVVSALRFFDFELSVRVLIRNAVFENDHSSDGVGARRV